MEDSKKTDALLFLLKFVRKNDHRDYSGGRVLYKIVRHQGFYEMNEEHFQELRRHEYVDDFYATEDKAYHGNELVYIVVTQDIHEKLQLVRMWQEL